MYQGPFAKRTLHLVGLNKISKRFRDSGGHSFISDVDNDLFTSPGDPLFWFHHAQVDRIWTIWQGQVLSTREAEIDGTITIANDT